MKRYRLIIRRGSLIEVVRGLDRRTAERTANREIALADGIVCEPEPEKVRGEGSYR